MIKNGTEPRLFFQISCVSLAICKTFYSYIHCFSAYFRLKQHKLIRPFVTFIVSVPILGCDSTSAFHSQGKVKPLKVLDCNPEFFETFKNIGSSLIASTVLEKELEKFVCILYKQKEVDDVDMARYNIFRLGKYGGSDMPCTKDALYKHIRRVTFQATIWRRSLDPMMNCPDIAEHGWIVDEEGKVSIDWMDLPPAPNGILENVQCACKTGCISNRCSCRRANLKCTSLCRCNSCSNSVVVDGGRAEDDSDDGISNSSDEEDSDIDDGY